MASEFKLSVVAPDRTVAETQAVSLIAPGSEGYIGIMAHHVPMIVALKPGLLSFVDHSGTRHFAWTAGGFVEVSAGSVIVLADQAELAKDIDLKEAEALLEAARASLRGEPSEMTSEQATEEIEKAIARVNAARMA